MIRAAMVGCGLFSGSHAAALQALGDVELTAVFDTNGERARQFTEQYSVPVVAESLEDLIAEPVQAVHVVTPESQHRPPVSTELSAGKHVLVEMAAAAQNFAGILMVEHILRFDLRYGTSKQSVQPRRSL
jgi:UDP-N-acetyl-2-amino-2-deoxyglucuronate dehydrogenase